MAAPRRAFGASPPRGRHRRTGGAGSVVAAWGTRALRAALWGLLAAGLHFPAFAESGRTPLPVIEKAKAGTACVEPGDVMRRKHMDYLKHQRDETVHGGVRGAKYSLKDCIDCHASAKTASVTKAETNFCVSCHSYAAVKIDCFECHSNRPRAVAQALAKGAPK